MKMISNPNLPRYTVLEKAIGETPLERVESWRQKNPDLIGVPLAYAGRLDPMASGKLLVLIGDECKVQEQYHGLDKEYVFEILFSVSSDSGDVLGIIAEKTQNLLITPEALTPILNNLIGMVTLPYPIFSARTVLGKPLHTWAMEGRLSEISIPTKTSQVYSLTLGSIRMSSRSKVYENALAKINSLPAVTDPRKALGNDFRRPEVKASWSNFLNTDDPTDNFAIATVTCIASSGTYMRSLAEEIGKRLNTQALAFSIHRTKIGQYDTVTQNWKKLFE
jgi:tRNA pseudouridine(55) synthase